MCGIAGVLSRHPALAKDAVGRMMALQEHRGPDDGGIEAFTTRSGTLVLGHRRLAIQDLSVAGHQPMRDPFRGDAIVFNGEIYNHPSLREQLEKSGPPFRSNCDTESILRAYANWGVEAFKRLHGMFAFGLYVPSERRLFLVRDPLGIKPLYYSLTSQALVFASEVRAIAGSGAISCNINRRAVASVLAYGSVMGPLTMLENVNSLEPGAFVEFDVGGEELVEKKCRRFWSFPAVEASHLLRLDVIEETRKHVVSAVGSQLLSDVPVGVFLSGGIDSSCIAAVCSHLGQAEVGTYTVCLDNDPTIDEGEIAAQTASALNLKHTSVRITDSELPALVRKWLNCIDQPTVDGLNTYIISKAVREHGVVVALSGLGGDELFGGYSTFRDVPRLARFSGWLRWLPPPLRKRLARSYLRSQSRVVQRKGSELAASSLGLRHLYFRRRRLLSDAELFALGFDRESMNLDEDWLPAEAAPDRGLPLEDAKATIRVLESRFYMGNTLLRDSDVFGMAHGLEIRVPLLDTALAEHAYSIPGKWLASDSDSKTLLVDALRPFLPPMRRKVPKRGFALPYARWMSGPLKEHFSHLLGATKQSGLFLGEGVDAIWQEFMSESSAWPRAWILGVLGQWINTSSMTDSTGSTACQLRTA